MIASTTTKTVSEVMAKRVSKQTNENYKPQSMLSFINGSLINFQLKIILKLAFSTMCRKQRANKARNIRFKSMEFMIIANREWCCGRLIALKTRSDGNESKHRCRSKEAQLLLAKVTLKNKHRERKASNNISVIRISSGN